MKPIGTRVARLVKLFESQEQEIGDARHPIRLRVWDSSSLSLPGNSTHFGFCVEGKARIEGRSISCNIQKTGFFRLIGPATIQGQHRGFVLSVPGIKGFDQISSNFSEVPLIPYLPGGRQNCLVWPAGLYFPTMNTLKMSPKQIQQDHSHDSLRVNVIIDGAAQCVLSNDAFGIVKYDLLILSANERHRFETRTLPMTFIAFHPDSDADIFSEHRNPMILKTIGLMDDKIK